MPTIAKPRPRGIAEHMLGAACACALLAAAWQPALRPLQQPAARPSTTTCHRAASADMVLPKAVAVVPFIPWVFVIVTNNLPTELRLKIQKSPLLQRGITLRTMKKEPPKVRPARLTPEVLAITQSFRKQYATKDLEYLWAALLKCYGTKQRALAAIEANPQSALRHSTALQCSKPSLGPRPRCLPRRQSLTRPTRSRTRCSSRSGCFWA